MSSRILGSYLVFIMVLNISMKDSIYTTNQCIINTFDVPERTCITRIFAERKGVSADESHSHARTKTAQKWRFRNTGNA